LLTGLRPAAAGTWLGPSLVVTVDAKRALDTARAMSTLR
jgi:hypothetical protein